PDDRLNVGRRALLAGVAGAGAATAVAGPALAQAGAQASLMEGCISVLDFVPPAERKAIRNRKPTGDVSRHVREAVRHLTDNSILLLPQGVYPMEALIEDPVLKTPFASAYAEGLTNVAVFGYGATIRRTEKV